MYFYSAFSPSFLPNYNCLLCWFQRLFAILILPASPRTGRRPLVTLLPLRLSSAFFFSGPRFLVALWATFLLFRSLGSRPPQNSPGFWESWPSSLEFATPVPRDPWKPISFPPGPAQQRLCAPRQAARPWQKRCPLQEKNERCPVLVSAHPRGSLVSAVPLHLATLHLGVSAAFTSRILQFSHLFSSCCWQ